jgi:hypothetical protein
MKTRLRPALLAFGLLTLAGCGENAGSLLRRGANYRSELTDRLSRVDSEESAKKFIDHHLKVYAEKLKTLDDLWVKWIKDIEDDYRGKKRVISFVTRAELGSKEWMDEAKNHRGKDDTRFDDTREAFVSYVKRINADKDRFNREKQRIADLVQKYQAEGKDCPNLMKIGQPETFRAMLLTGSEKKAPQPQN